MEGEGGRAGDGRRCVCVEKGVVCTGGARERSERRVPLEVFYERIPALSGQLVVRETAGREAAV